MQPRETKTAETDICPRCEQLVSPQNGRCPRCGSPMTMRSRRWAIWFGIAGVAALAFVIYLMVVVMQNDEEDSGATTTEQTSK